MSIMDDAINSMNYDKETLKDICKQEIALCINNGYINEYIKVLNENIEKVSDIDLNKLEKVLGRKMTNKDIADFFSYKFYIQKEVQDTDIVKVIMIDDRCEELINRTGFSYIWNKRKAELSFLKYGLKFIDAIELLETAKVEKFARSDSRILNFTITHRNIFVVITIELQDGRLKRIISFRPSTVEELNNAEVKYERV